LEENNDSTDGIGGMITMPNNAGTSRVWEALEVSGSNFCE